MAASDPTPYVATPAGTLQGVAAFSWDGSAWQPTGRAGPDVATPTGVLQGVAPFSWSGSAWTPAGLAQPGVATPSGVLDGVAVYTWSGSAWTPASGTATPATPGGALRGVAAFSWDGAAWQPAAQARASVPTPYGVLDGVAMFEWGGTAWQAGAAVPAGATLDLSFLSGALDPRITFTRASTATYFDATGTMQTAATNAPRFDYDPVTHALRGLLIEEARTNLALWSATINNGSVWITGAATTVPDATTSPDGTLAAELVVESATTALHIVSQSHIGTSETATVSAYLKAAGRTAAFLSLSNQVSASIEAYFDLSAGVVLSVGAPNADYTAPSASIQAVGSGWYRCAITATKGTANSNNFVALGPSIVSNRNYAGDGSSGIYVWGAQLEIGAFPTSYVPTTGATVARSADLASMPNPAGFSTTSGTYQGEFIPNGVAAGLPYVVGGNAGSPTVGIGADSRLTAGIRSGAAVFSATGPLYTFSAVNKAAFAYLSGASTAAVNGTAFGPSATALTVTGTVVEFGSDGVTPGNNALNGYIRRVRYWPRGLSNAELQSVTT